MRSAAALSLIALAACATPSRSPSPLSTPGSAVVADAQRDRFLVTNTVDRLADGTLADCRLADAPSEGACDVWREGEAGPAAFARSYRPGEAVRLTFTVDVRPWTGALQPVAVPGRVEQVVLLGGEEADGCARLGQGGPALSGWGEVAACPAVDDAAAFFTKLADPRPRQSTWTLAAEPLPR